LQAKQITEGQAFDRGQKPIREFMFKQTREKDLALFVKLAKMDRPETRADVPTHVLIPAFIISELKTAFQIGFLIFLPFLVIDLVVSSTLMSMGMIMLPPVFISLPFKILLFVLVDGWNLVTRSLVESFG
ncbi:MAG TPA: flagellar biosynthetic protein FliP, partial [Solirubrobacteraceae bacterium]|nr:flagellar biosynthetic protein FliP [Solirubrobacteraceae bacterium]